VILELTSYTSPGKRRACVDRSFARIEYVQAKRQVVTVVQLVGKPRADSPHLIHGNTKSTDVIVHGFLNPQQAYRSAHFSIDRPAGADGRGEKVVIEVFGGIEIAALQ